MLFALRFYVALTHLNYATWVLIILLLYTILTRHKLLWFVVWLNGRIKFKFNQCKFLFYFE